jgi:hypothetical protein
MDEQFLECAGRAVDARNLRLDRARLLLDAITNGSLDFVRPVECHQRESVEGQLGDEIVVFDLDIQRPQLTVHDIRYVERVAAVFPAGDDNYPEVLALRSDFPYVPHVNLRAEEFPRSLCLYDQAWEVVRARWTAPSFIERIRRWLADTATGTLHRDDQPLEPLIFGTGYSLVIPIDAVKVRGETAQKLDVELVQTGENRGTLIARKSQAPRQPGEMPKFIAAFFVADARQHGVIRRAPRNLDELASFVRGEGFDLIAELRQRVKQWKDDGCLDASLIIVIAFPLQRTSQGEAEINDIWAFLTSSTVFEVGKRLGIWDRMIVRNKPVVALMMSADESCRGGDIGIDVLRPQFSFSRESAARASGVEPDRRKIAAVGAGALGSQIIINLVRGGFGAWTIIDEDDFMPHNQARHALPAWCVGSSKAQAIAVLIEASYQEDMPTQFMAANVLRPGDQKEKIESAFKEAELILDCSASVPVSRFLAGYPETKARRASLFLNPLGTDLVCLGEGQSRSVPLDCLEMQYYRAIVRDDRLEGHLAANPDKSRYARSCRDVSFTLPTHVVSIHAGIGAQAVRNVTSTEEASIGIWRCDAATCQVKVFQVQVHAVRRARLGDWTLVMDEWLLEELQRLRAAKLPNETGGMLLGAYDLPQKIVYVVDTVPSPPDSQEWPTLYIRGCEGLKGLVDAITAMTAGQLEYVGEWHSHPDQCPCLPSADDLTVFSWMTESLSAAGLPALMAIMGEHNASMWFLGNMERDGGWDPRQGD